jgi:hypothetical protein
MRDIVIVGGKWDDIKGKSSGYIAKLHDELEKQFNSKIKLYNGGEFNKLKNIIDNLNDEILFWFADIDNNKEKIIQGIKENHNKIFLITSKNNYSKKYDFLYLIAHALKNKSNLFIEFEKDESIILASVYDTLGNSYGEKIKDINKLSEVIYKRIKEIIDVKRFKSEKIGENIPPEIGDEEDYFICMVKKYADVFHELIHGVNHSRFMGNCSFRCSKGGFPSFRQKGMIYVSRRNIDKRQIGKDGFVSIEPIPAYDVSLNKIKVQYYGENKPSVDTPVQLALYSLYKNINYMIHSHVYIQDAPFTKNVIPCGAIEEVEDILEIISNKNICDFAINLNGHGSIFAADKAIKIGSVNYIPRVFPEFHCLHEV